MKNQKIIRTGIRRKNIVSYKFDVLEDALLKTNEYLQLLFEGKMDEAKDVRLSTIPDKLIQFIWLDGSATDNKKFLSLKRNEIWFGPMSRFSTS